jgi:hemerythrin
LEWSLEFVWTEKLAVGVKEIDIQHRVLFEKINDLVKALDSQESAAHIEQFFDFLEEYAASHFSMEQKAMGVYKYPDRKAHIEQHNIFNAAICDLRASFKEHGVTSGLTSRLRTSVCDWLIDHVMVVDMALGAFLKPRATAF